MSLNYKIRPMRASDMAKVIEMFVEADFPLGEHGNHTMLRACPEGLLVAELVETGEVIGTITATNVSETLAYVSQYVVDKCYRGQGVGQQLWAAMLKHTGNRVLCLFTSTEMRPVYEGKLGFSTTGEVNIRFQGVPKVEELIQEIEGVSVVPLSEENLAQVIPFDFSVARFKRKEYLRQLIREPEAVNLVALQASKKVVGWASLATTVFDQVVFQPIYAVSGEIAELLIRECLSRGKDLNNELIMRCLRSNSINWKPIIQKLGLEKIKEFEIMANGLNPVCDFKKNYCISNDGFYHY